jgi:hypothetical protein
MLPGQQIIPAVRLMWQARFDAVRYWLRHAALDPDRDRYWCADGYQLPRRLGWPIWAAASALFLITYSVMWSVVHVRIDQRPCALVLDDPLFHLIPYDPRWFWLTHQLYTGLTLLSVAVLAGSALMGDHRPLVAWGTALGFQAVLRSTTLILLPLCRFTVAPGTRVIDAAPSLNLGLFSVPWRAWATNDLVFSGHVGEFLLLYWVTRHWPPVVRIGLALFQVIQIYALLATRGHYTIDIVVAVPCALLEFRLALWLLLRSAGRRSAPFAA